MKVRISLILLVGFLYGCSTPSSRYNPENISILDLAFIEMEKIPFMQVRHSPSVVSVMDEDGNEVITTSFGKSRHFNVALKEGKYAVVLECDDTYSYAFPLVPVNLQKGKKYLAYCRHKVVEGDSVGIEGFVLERTIEAPPRPKL
jgi:hypothetical protein